jgi:hypothetical protein
MAAQFLRVAAEHCPQVDDGTDAHCQAAMVKLMVEQVPQHMADALREAMRSCSTSSDGNMRDLQGMRIGIEATMRRIHFLLSEEVRDPMRFKVWLSLAVSDQWQCEKHADQQGCMSQPP